MLHFDTSSMAPLREKLEARTQIRRLIEQSRYQVTKAWINIVAMFAK